MTRKRSEPTGALLRTGYVAEKLGISPLTIRKWCDQSVIKAHLINGRYWIPRVELERLQKEGVPNND